MRRPDRAATALMVAVLTGAVTGCTDADGTPDRDSRATVETVPCPVDVELEIVAEHVCRTVALPMADGPVTRIFTVTVEPPGAPAGAPVLETGVELGMAGGYAGLAPIAARTGRSTVIVDLPGIRHSTPSLACPEAHGLVTTDADAVAGAVQACRQRLEDDGIDPAGYDVAALGEVLGRVAAALQEGPWVLMAHGSSGLAAIELARQDPDRVEALVLDSVSVDASDLDARTDTVVREVRALCAEDPRCQRRYAAALDGWSTASGDEAAEAARVLRHHAAYDQGAGLVPSLAYELVVVDSGPRRREAQDGVTGVPPLCIGYLPKCDGRREPALGAVLSAYCPLLAGQDPWRRPCEVWGAPAGSTPGSTPAAESGSVTGVPTLAVLGRLDPYTDPDGAQAALAAAVPDAFVVVDPIGTHNVLSDDCIRKVRDRWLAGDLTAPPPTPPCLTARVPDFT